MTHEITTVQFHGDDLLAVRDGERVWVPVKRICEVLGIDDEGQRQKLKERRWATTCVIKAVAEDGKNRELFCVDLDSLPTWLVTIDANRVRVEAREKVERYQDECARVLRDHFFSKPAKHPLFALQASSWELTWTPDVVQALCALYGNSRHYTPGGRMPGKWFSAVETKIYRYVWDSEHVDEAIRRMPEPKSNNNWHQLLTPQARVAFQAELAVIAQVATSLLDHAEPVGRFWEWMDGRYKHKPLQLGLRGMLMAPKRPAEA